MKEKAKLNKITAMYLQKVSKRPAFNNGKPTKDFWMVRGYFKKQKADYVNLIYDYLESQDEFDFMTLYTLIDNAKRHQIELRWRIDKERLSIISSQHKPYSYELLMNL